MCNGTGRTEPTNEAAETCSDRIEVKGREGRNLTTKVAVKLITALRRFGCPGNRPSDVVLPVAYPARGRHRV